MQRSYAVEGNGESDQHCCYFTVLFFSLVKPLIDSTDNRWKHVLHTDTESHRVYVCVYICGFLIVLLPVCHAQQAIATGTQPWHRPRRYLSRGHRRCDRMIRLRNLGKLESVRVSWTACIVVAAVVRAANTALGALGSEIFMKMDQNSEFRRYRVLRTSQSPESNTTQPCSQLLQFLKSLRWQEFLQIRSLRLKLLWRWGYLLSNQKLRTNHATSNSGYELIWKWKCETRSLDWS